MLWFYVIFHIFPEKIKESGFQNFVKVVKKCEFLVFELLRELETMLFQTMNITL